MIDTKALRSRVLDLAIQGKLTEQHENQKWKTVSFGNLFNLSNGTASRGSSEGESHPVLRLADLKSGQIETKNIREVILTDKEYASHTLQKNDLIIIRVNGSKEKVATAFLYEQDNVISYCDHLFCAHPKTDEVYCKYIILLFGTEYIKKQVYPRIKTTAGQNTISQSNLNSIEFPLPPLAEQKRIVSRVEEIFRLLDIIDAAQEQYAADAESLKAKLITLGIQGRLTEQLASDGTAEELFQQIQAEKQRLIKEGKLKKEKPLPPISKDEIPFEIPENWKWVRLDEVFTLQAGKFVAASAIHETESADNPFKCYGGNGIRGYVSEYNVSGAHALIGRQGALCGNINFAEDLFYATEHAVVVYHYANTDVKWVFHALKELNLNQYATSVAQPGLAVGKIGKVLLPLPPLAEQKRIAETLERVLGVLD